MNTRVLLIDDDSDEHDIFSSALRNFDSRIICVTANSWIESSMLLQHFLPDIIFLDYNMPHTNGVQALALIKNIPDLRNTRVYIYSTAHGADREGEVTRMGAVRWITKPSKIEDYHAIFNEVFSK